ncbi:uncharacterized protein F5147DRAFT_678994 [Suillus discolor]|uniref:Uncharacterized protein n=1 Tax=Suillus discolor TaxID=1912936 RepID=A0A9P7FE53_9AGAM|nr:uncharacterized protein F5147DRAFT_678994 [Suillus discolor]KAG2114318.1 hypothetical protein F5147DRAFT_678994 [Suillus discolor]
MLFRAIQTSQDQPYTRTFIDKPQEDQIYLFVHAKPRSALNLRTTVFDGRPRKSIHYACPTWYTGTRSRKSQIRLHIQLPRHSSMAYTPTLMPLRRQPPPTSVVHYSRGHTIHKSRHHIIMFAFSPLIAYRPPHLHPHPHPPLHLHVRIHLPHRRDRPISLEQPRRR